MNRLFILTGLCIWLGSCKQYSPTQESVDIQHKGDTIVVSAGSSLLAQISVEESRPEDFQTEFRTVGTVRPVSGRLAEIASPFAGRIVRSFVKLGQKVSAGSPVFELGSPEFYEATKVYFAAQSAAELAGNHYRRQQELAGHGVASQRDLEQARSEAGIAAREFEQAQATMQVFNIDVASVRMGQALTVVSPISGEVVKYNLTIGSYAREDAEPLAVVADLSHVWVAALVKEKYFGAIRPGDRVEVFTDAHPDKTIWGTIDYIGQMLDEETRSLEVIVACDNAGRDLKLGMFCEVHFLSAPTKAILLPSTAIMKEEDDDYVLIEVAGGMFVRRKVESETAGTNSVRITDGLTGGEKIVVKGGIFLNV